MRSIKTFVNLSLLTFIALSPMQAHADDRTVDSSFKAPYISKLDRSQGMKPVYGVKEVKVSAEFDDDWAAPYATYINDCIMMELGKYKSKIDVQALIFTSINQIKIEKGGFPFYYYFPTFTLAGERGNSVDYDEGKKVLTIKFNPKGTPSGPGFCQQDPTKSAIAKIWELYWKNKGNVDREIASVQPKTEENKPGFDSKVVQGELNRAAQDAMALPEEVNATVGKQAKPCP